MLSSKRLFYKHVNAIPKVINFKVRPCHGKTSRKGKEEIIIPERIERGPTDILQALSSTVLPSPSTFHYKFPDDPYFYPYSVSVKRVMSMALESGRKSAKWIIKENPGFFKHQLADPPIQAFLPVKEKEQDKDFIEQDLIDEIEERNVSRAIKVYETLKKEEIEISNSTKQSLLELVCFYNSKDAPELDLEVKWYEDYLGKAGSELQSENKHWDNDGFAESLFQEMDPDCPLANSAIIQGRLKYGNFNSALELFNACKEKRMPLAVGVYNGLLFDYGFFIRDKGKISDFVNELLVFMSENQIKPNLGTLNAGLKMCSKLFLIGKMQRFVKEFLLLGVEPSLGSYAYLFEVFAKCKNQEMKAELKSVVLKLLESIEHREHEIRHPSDFEFFNVAMDAFVEGYEDPDLALRLADMLFRNNNLKFVIKESNDNAIIKQLLTIMFKKKPLDFAMSVYERYLFTWICPESKVISAMLTALSENHSPQYLPKVWDDLQKLGYGKNRPLLARLFKLMEYYTDEASLKVFHSAALFYLDKTFEEFRSGDEENLLPVITVLIKNDDEGTIVKVMEEINRLKLSFIDVPDDFLKSFFEYAVSKQNAQLIVECLRLAVEHNYKDTSEMAKSALPLLGDVDGSWAANLIQSKKGDAGKQERKKRSKTVTNEPDEPVTDK